MIENAVGVIGLPVGIGLNFLVNGEDVLVPMAVEEASVIAAVSLAAKIVREGGGFKADSDAPRMIGQVQVAELSNPEAAKAAILQQKDSILAVANGLHPAMKSRGGGAQDVEVRLLAVGAETHAIVHLIIDTQDAMGANLINTMCEGVAPLIERITRGRVRLRILSNLADLRLARASCRIPLEALADFGFSGAEVAHGIAEASRFADADPYRACTHNTGGMDGVDAVGLAQNMAALRALGTVGIQKGHMALHARNVAVSAGAKGSAVEEVARALIAAGEIKLHRAQEILAKMVAARGPSAEAT